MENTKGTPVEILTTALAEMTQRAIEAERQRDIEKTRGDEWYNNWIRQGEELAAAKEKLEMIEKYIKEQEQRRKMKIKACIERRKGAPTNE